MRVCFFGKAKAKDFPENMVQFWPAINGAFTTLVHVKAPRVQVG